MTISTSCAKVSILVVLLFLAFSAAQARAVSYVNVPLESWVYEALDKLEAYELLDRALSGTKPYSRLEAALLVAEGLKNWAELPAGRKSAGFAARTLIPSLCSRLQAEFRHDLAELGLAQAASALNYMTPLDEVQLKYLYQSDTPLRRPQQGAPATHLISPVYNDDGNTYRKHHNLLLSLAGQGRIFDHFSFFYRPIFKLHEGEASQVRLEKGYFKVGGANLELEVGRDSLWWGPGYHGSLLLTNNARPFDLIKLANARPYDLPYLGLFKFNLFLTRLDYEAPYIPKPLLYGLRLHIKPHPVLELGISHLAIFEGEGRKSLSFQDYLKIIYGNTNRDNTKLDSNQQVAVDFSLRWPNFDRYLPLARSLKLYGEMGAEDTGFLPDRRAFLLGLLFHDLFLWGRLDLRLEYADSFPEDVPGAWYTHGSYPPIYRERIFGHHMGSNAEDLFARLAAHLSENLLLGVDFNAQTQGKKNAIKTQTYRWGLDFDYQLNKQTTLNGRYTWELFRDGNNIAGGDRRSHHFATELRWWF